MKRAGLLLAAGIGSYLLVLLARFPADRLTASLQERFAPLQLHAVSGSVFSGAVARLEYEAIAAGPVRWTFRPSGLLRGRLEYGLQGRIMQQPFQGTAGFSPDGTLHVRMLEAGLDPAALVNAYSPVAVATAGQMSLHLESLAWREDFPDRLSGRLDWSGAAVREPVTLELGELEMKLTGDAGRVTGDVSNEGDTSITGRLSLSASGEYGFDLLLVPGESASPEVVGFLQAWGQPGPDGGYRLRDSGWL